MGSGALIYYLNSFINNQNIIMWIVSGIITFVVYNLIIIVLFRNTDEFKFFINKFKLKGAKS